MGALRMLQRPGPILALIALVALAVAAALLAGDRFSLTYYGDAAAHLVRTRQFVDSPHPGLDNIGTAWLPLPHLLLLPFAAVDPLFRTGLAGACVGIPALLIAVWFLYDGTRRLTHSALAAATAALVFGLNPNQIYLSITPMTEPVYLLFFTGALYGMYRWLGAARPAAPFPLPAAESPAPVIPEPPPTAVEQEPHAASAGETRWLTFAALFTMLATLSRYEAWPLPGVLAALAVYRFWRVRRSIGIGWREALAVALSCSGILAWLWWNWHLYGDPLRFAVEIHGAGFTAVRESLRGHPAVVLRLFFGGSLQVFGPLLPGFILWKALHKSTLRSAAPIAVLLLPAFFTIVAMLLGYVQMDSWGWNIRYVLVLAPFASVLAGTVVAEARPLEGTGKPTMLALAVLGVALAPLITPSGVATYNDASRQYYDETVWATDAGTNIGQLYDGGGVVLFTGYAQGQRIMMPSGLNLRHFTVVLPSSDSALREAPWRSCRYLVIALHPAPEMASLADYWLSHADVLYEHYTRIWSNRDYVILQRKEPPFTALN